MGGGLGAMLRNAVAANQAGCADTGAGMGLPAVGWERADWGGLGWDGDEPSGI